MTLTIEPLQGFSNALYPFFRDENGQSRIDTLVSMTYTDWQTRLGIVNHDVSALVTPAILVSLYNVLNMYLTPFLAHSCYNMHYLQCMYQHCNWYTLVHIVLA